jgi:hypothetical protein
VEGLAGRMATVLEVVTVTLAGSRAAGTAVEGQTGSRGCQPGGLDPADNSVLG